MVTDAGAARYAAFISYSHKDSAVARTLHSRLERYRIPKRLIGSAGEHGPVPARLTPIFRDRDEFPAAGDLSEKVRAALAASDALVVLCSPDAAASPWVAREIGVFRELHPARPILAAVIAGEPGDCFPEALGRLDAAGNPIEPLAADLRKTGDGARLGFLKLVAGLTGVGLDALVQRDAARAIRRVTAVTLTALAATLVMAVLTVVALNARREADRQRAEAEGLVEFMLTDLRTKLKGVGRLEVLGIVNTRALDFYAKQSLDGLPPDSLERRARILHAMGEDEEAEGHLERALLHFQQAENTTGALLAADPNDPERIFNHAQSQFWIGHIAEARGKYPQALAAYRAYRSQAERLNQIAPGRARNVGELAYAESNLGSLQLKGFKSPASARTHLERALALFRKAAQLDPKDRTWPAKIANNHSWTADCWYTEKRYAEARAERSTELAGWRQLVALEPQNVIYRYRLIVNARAIALIDVGEHKYTAAEAGLASVRKTILEFLEHDPANLKWRHQAVLIECDLAELLLETGRPAASRLALARARALFADLKDETVEWSTVRAGLQERIAKITGQIEHFKLH